MIDLTQDIQTLCDSYVANNCGELLLPNGEIAPAPEGWGVNPEEERDGRMGREFYYPARDVAIWVPLAPPEVAQTPAPARP